MNKILNSNGKVHLRECDNCGIEFMQKVSRQRYCSNQCRIDDQIKGTFVIYERDGFKCTYCGRTPYEHGIVLVLDHIVPVIEGGTDRANNLIASCSDCNLTKSCNKLSEETHRNIAAIVEQKNTKSGISQTQKIKLPTGSTAERRIERKRNGHANC
jgi:5-methylcytosine-specific restriction endonuclease McrA